MLLSIAGYVGMCFAFRTLYPGLGSALVTDDNETRRNFSMLRRTVINEMTNEKTAR
jgi:hypothetical protein